MSGDSTTQLELRQEKFLWSDRGGLKSGVME